MTGSGPGGYRDLTWLTWPVAVMLVAVTLVWLAQVAFWAAVAVGVIARVVS